MTILEMCLEKLFDKNEEIVRLVYVPPGRGGGGGYAEQAMVFIFKILSLKQGI